MTLASEILSRLLRRRFPVPRRRCQGFTLTEVMIAAAVSMFVAVGAFSLTIMSGRLDKSIASQQRFMKDARRAIEWLNRELRVATTDVMSPISVYDDDGDAAVRGNRVEFSRSGEAAGLRAFYLESDDDDMMTPWDNRLFYDPNTGAAGDEILVSRDIAPVNPNGAFQYEGASEPVVIQMRTGDPANSTNEQEDWANSGANLQGVEINIRIAPRN